MRRRRMATRKRTWSFGGNIPAKFVDHIRRSVPWYDEGHELVCTLSEFFCRSGGLCYELGASTGQLTAKLARRHDGQGVRFVGIDSEPAMVAYARRHCAGMANVTFLSADCTDMSFEPCDLVVSYYCLQFVPFARRPAVVRRVFRGLNPGGAFVLFEKVAGDGARAEEILSGAYVDFKARNRFTGDEILGKSRSLRGLLTPQTSGGNVAMLRQAGFRTVVPVMRYLCFEGLLAVKGPRECRR